MMVDRTIRGQAKDKQEISRSMNSNLDSLSANEVDNLNHGCHRHWAFALFKKGEMAKAIKKIKKSI